MSTQSGILVLLQFICLTYLVIFSEFLAQGIYLMLQVCGLLIALWAVIVMRPGKFNIQPELKSNANFIMSGPYRLIRNPMYAGLILICGASVLPHPKLDTVLVYSLLLIVLICKIYIEEKYLSNRFGETYLQYKKKTFRLLPFIY